jgi:hypothetical protein
MGAAARARRLQVGFDLVAADDLRSCRGRSRAVIDGVRRVPFTLG